MSDPRTDDLRTRIAKVLYQRFAPQIGMADAEWDDEHLLCQEEWRRDADAVIEKLGVAAACKSGCVWDIPNRVEDMTDKQRELLERGDDE